MKRGFTLIELLVVVLIIAVLAAIALPQYQKAVLKSRYSVLMPIASAVADAQEIYYMEHGNYSNYITSLDVKIPERTNIDIEINEAEPEYKYVLVSRDDLPGLVYVIYQKHSRQFSGMVMCEANDLLNKNATWLCHEGLKGKLASTGSLQGLDWRAYFLSGNEGNNKFICSAGKKPTDIVASQSKAVGKAVCDEQTNTYQYVWSNGNTYENGQCTAFNAYGCAGASFRGTNTYCAAFAENACLGGSLSQGARCSGWKERGCSGAIFTEGAYCYGNAPGGCVGAIINDGGYCQGQGCDDAVYSENGTGCCKGGCSANSGIRKCPSGVWDGETYW